MKGETVFVESSPELGRDAFGAPVFGEAVLNEVENVLVAPGPRTDVTEPNRPEGTYVKYTLHFPKAFEGSLEGRFVWVRGERLKVVGAPARYTSALTPTLWDMPAEVEAVHG